MRTNLPGFALVLAMSGLVSGLLAQSPARTTKNSPAVDRFPFAENGLSIRRHVEAGKPFTVAGPRGVVLGQQEGTFEAWVLPVKLLSHFAIRAEVTGYTVPIDLNAEAAEIEVGPDRTTITYAHIAFTVRQTMFAPENGEPVVLFEIDSTR